MDPMKSSSYMNGMSFNSTPQVCSLVSVMDPLCVFPNRTPSIFIFKTIA